MCINNGNVWLLDSELSDGPCGFTMIIIFFLFYSIHSFTVSGSKFCLVGILIKIIFRYTYLFFNVAKENYQEITKKKRKNTISSNSSFIISFLCMLNYVKPWQQWKNTNNTISFRIGFCLQFIVEYRYKFLSIYLLTFSSTTVTHPPMVRSVYAIFFVH